MYSRVYTFCRFLALNFTHNIHDTPNLFSTFVFMLIIIILSFVDWQHGGGVFHTCTCENEHFSHVRQSVHIFYRFLALSFTHNIHEAPNLISTLFFMLIIIILSFEDWRHSSPHGSPHVRMRDSHIPQYTAMCTHFIGFLLLIPHTSSLKLQTATLSLF